MIIKELKIWSEYLDDIIEDKKTFELRFNDKDFQNNELIMLKEFDPSSQTYMKRHLLIQIIKVYRNLEKFGLKEGYCIFTFKKICLMRSIF